MAPTTPPPLTSRATAAVGVLGLGRLGLLTTLSLATSGIGRLVLDDARHVTQADLGPGGYGSRDVGSLRRIAAARLVAESASGTSSRVAPSRPHDVPLAALDMLVVVTDEDLAPDRAWRLMGERVPHLVVRCRPDAVDVSHVVVPGRTPCLRCISLHTQDERGTDAFTASAWAPSGPRAPRVRELTPDEPLLASAAAVVVTRSVLAFLDTGTLAVTGAEPTWDRSCRTVVTSTHLALPDIRAREERWPVHPGCGCTGQGAVRSSSRAATA